MCTLTFSPTAPGYLVGMNRDEKRTRPIAQVPSCHQIGGRQVLCPSEKGGGTWIATNDSGVTFALLNWYGVPPHLRGPSLSRGEVVRRASATADIGQADALIRSLALERVRPFRLVGIFLPAEAVVEWQWDSHMLARFDREWRLQHWASSSWDENLVQRVRETAFVEFCRQEDAGSMSWLRRWHGSHDPKAGPTSVCMHRPDATTVSYTEITVSARQSLLTYHAGCPCTATDSTRHFEKEFRFQVSN